MDDNTLIFPRCGLTYGDVKEVAQRSGSMRHGAKLLGVSDKAMYSKSNIIGGLFTHKKNRSRKVSKVDIVELARQGYIRKDVAYMLEISNAYLKDLIKLWKIEDEFKVTHGNAAWVNRKGYCT